MDEMEETESWERASERKGVYRGCLRVSPPSLTWCSPFFGLGFMLSHEGLPALWSPSHPATHSCFLWSLYILGQGLGGCFQEMKGQKLVPFQVLLSEKILNMSHSVKSGTGGCCKFMFDYIFDPILGQRLDHPRLPKVISEMMIMKSLAFHLAPKKSSLNLNYYYHLP